MPQSSTVVIHHHDDSDEELENELQDLSYSLDSPTSPSRRRTNAPKTGGTADKAGVILGIHNVFVVLPQFIVTVMASIIFHIMEPPDDTGVPPKHPHAIPIGNGTIADASLEGIRLVMREGAVEGGSSDAVGLIFRYVVSSQEGNKS
jgi:solute carrier family 45 protein 1/2/4